MKQPPWTKCGGRLSASLSKSIWRVHEDVAVKVGDLIREYVTMRRALQTLANPTSEPVSEEATLLQMEVIAIAESALDGSVGPIPHPAGYVLRDRDDGLHWLRCVDCDREWAEKDDGSFAKGSRFCGI